MATSSESLKTPVSLTRLPDFTTWQRKNLERFATDAYMELLNVQEEVRILRHHHALQPRLATVEEG